MTTNTEAPRRQRSLGELLLLELAPREGRSAAVARIAICCAITVAIAMVFEIPQPTYMAYVVFTVSRDERSSTITAAIGGVVAATLAVVLTLGLSLIDTSEPALRLPLMTLATFVGMYIARTFALGPIAYLAGFVIVLLQSMVDDMPGTETLTRAELWTWVIVTVPIGVTLLVNLLFGQSVQMHIDRTFRGVLAQLAQLLASGDYRDSLPVWRARIAPLQETARHIPKGRAQTGHTTAPMIAALLDALVILEALSVDSPPALRAELARHVREAMNAMRTPGAARSREPTPGPHSGDDVTAQFPAAASFLATLTRMLEPPGGKNQASVAPAGQPGKLPFVADAFTNPAHWQFALKTTVAAMSSYMVYTLLDWPGLRTSIVTCFFVALASLGETVHKLILRISGALIGGFAAGLCIVYVVPHLTDIGQLCLLIGLVSLGAAWVATSSEALSYCGMQIAFAFFLGILHGYAPANDLTVLRDRVVGILLGNFAIALVFGLLWPVSVSSGVRAALVEALRGIAEVLKGTSDTTKASARTINALVRADHLNSLRQFELQVLPQGGQSDQRIPLVNEVDRLAGAALVVISEAMTPPLPRRSTEAYGVWIESVADAVQKSSRLTVGTSLAIPPFVLAAGEARSATTQNALWQLDSEVRRVASAMH